MELDKVLAIVTGGASGLGRATAARLVAAGGRVALLDRRSSSGDAVARELGTRACFTPADVTSAGEVAAALQEAEARLGGLNVLVNCAGIGVAVQTLGPRGPARLEDFTRVIQVNLLGTYNCLRLAAARMAKNEPSSEGERGVVINTASAAAFDGQVGQAAYAASKAGIVGMTLPIARDLADLGIRVVTLAPGLFETPMTASLPEPVRASLEAQRQFPRRLGDPDEFAGFALHVVQNVMLNAATIRIDGGVRMAPR
jgi:3-hydroxyacyl-CoA dehydrogenase/3-hydroxy-2-methylbutyryl-CoA dehydrogenase